LFHPDTGGQNHNIKIANSLKCVKVQIFGNKSVRSWRMRQGGHVAHMGEVTNVCIFVGKLVEMDCLGDGNTHIKMIL
jgi:hypothetical protein